MFRESVRSKRLVLVALLLALALAAAVQSEEAANPNAPIKNLQYQSADIRSVITFLADYGGINVVISPDVKGAVTIKLRDVAWRQALEIVGRTYDLAVVEEAEGYIRVLPAEAYRKEQSENEKHRSAQFQLVKLETQIVKISNSTAKDIADAVKSLLTDRGKASADQRSNSVIIQEVPENIPAVLKYIAELDRPSRQIKISTQLLEIFTNDYRELGIDWEVAGTYTSESGRTISQTGTVDANDVGNADFSYSVMALQRGYSVEALVEAIVSNGKGKILAHPEITTVDNREARIQMGAKVPIKSFDEAGNVVIKFEEVGTILTVTPHITAENQVLMHLKPERSTYEYDPNGVIINTSNAETNVIVGNGQTAVIGGLTTEDEVESEHGVPLLKDIPLLGYLFKFQNTRTESRDLVIFVTPTIVDADIAQEG